MEQPSFDRSDRGLTASQIPTESIEQEERNQKRGQPQKNISRLYIHAHFPIGTQASLQMATFFPSQSLQKGTALIDQRRDARVGRTGHCSSVFDGTDAHIVQMLPMAFIQRHRVLPMSVNGNVVKMGFVDDVQPAMLGRLPFGLAFHWKGVPLDTAVELAWAPYLIPFDPARGDLAIKVRYYF